MPPISNSYTGWERLIRTRSIRSSAQFEVPMKSLPDSYHFMSKMNGQPKHGQFKVPPI